MDYLYQYRRKIELSVEGGKTALRPIRVSFNTINATACDVDLNSIKSVQQTYKNSRFEDLPFFTDKNKEEVFNSSETFF